MGDGGCGGKPTGGEEGERKRGGGERKRRGGEMKGGKWGN